jgi:hypothetical protein
LSRPPLEDYVDELRARRAEHSHVSAQTRRKLAVIHDRLKRTFGEVPSDVETAAEASLTLEAAELRDIVADWVRVQPFL